MITKTNAIPNAIAWCLANPGKTHSIPIRICEGHLHHVLLQNHKTFVDCKMTDTHAVFVYNPPQTDQ